MAYVWLSVRNWQSLLTARKNMILTSHDIVVAFRIMFLIAIAVVVSPDLFNDIIYFTGHNSAVWLGNEHYIS